MQHLYCIKTHKNCRENKKAGCYEICFMFQLVIFILSGSAADSDGLSDVIDTFVDEDEKLYRIEQVIPNVTNILLDLYEKMTTLVAEVAEYKNHGQTDRLAFVWSASPVVFNHSNRIF